MKKIKGTMILLAALTAVSSCGGGKEIVSSTTAVAAVQTTVSESQTTASESTTVESFSETTVEAPEEDKKEYGVFYTYGDYEYKLSSPTTVDITKYNGSDSVLEIPGEIEGYTVRYIEEEAFAGCDSLKEVIIGEGVQEVMNRAFADCSNLEKVTLPSTLTYLPNMTFAGCAFSGCDNIKTLVISSIPENLKANFHDLEEVYVNAEIPEGANLSLETKKYIIADGIERIGFRTFNVDEGTEFVLPESLKTLGELAFDGKQFEIELPEGVTEIDPNAFRGSGVTIKFKGKIYTTNNVSDLIARINDPSSSDDAGSVYDVVTPDSSCFRTHYDAALKGIIIDGYIGKDDAIRIPVELDGDPVKGFSLGKADVKYVEVPEEFTEISDNAFSSCSKLITVSIPAGVTRIGDKAFLNCGSLLEINIPDSVTEIGAGAFSQSGLFSLEIPDSVVSVGKGLFTQCRLLESVKLPEHLQEIPESAFDSCSVLSSVVMPEDAAKIGDKAFINCEKLEEITLADTITEIGSEAFKHCFLLKNISLPKSLEKLGSSAFYGCKLIDSVTIPSAVTRIEAFTFCGCEALKEVTVPAGLVMIGQGAFKNCGKIRDLELPDSMQKIETLAFDKCDALTVVYKGTKYTHTNFDTLYSMLFYLQ